MTLFGWWLFNDIPNHATLIGAGIVIASGGYLLWREWVVMGEARRTQDKT
jgi:drug/metabolite transporter (DMT)-like permease